MYPPMLRQAGLVALLVALGGFLPKTPVSGQDHDTVEDRLAIAERLAQYAYRWDAKDARRFADLFTEDAVIERWQDNALVDGSRVVGRPAIFEYARASHEGRLADRQTRHHMSALVFLELSGDMAVTENMVLITHQRVDDRTPFISGSGIYRNTWRRTDRGWQIAERVLFTDRPR